MVKRNEKDTATRTDVVRPEPFGQGVAGWFDRWPEFLGRRWPEFRDMPFMGDVCLMEQFTDDDGTLDDIPWTSVIDGLALVEDANRTARQLAWAGLRSRHPGESDSRRRRRLLDLVLGEETAVKIYGPVDEIDE